MNLRSLCLVFVLGVFFQTQAQLVKSFDLLLPSQQSTLVLSGNKNLSLPFTWTSGKNTAPVGTNFHYSIFFDLPSGDFSMPLANLTKSCCAPSFSDSVFTYNAGEWADFLNPISQQLRGREFLIGDTLDLKWRVVISAAAPGPVYENATCSQDFNLRFIRGQFDSEYVPVSLYNPAPNAIVPVGGDPAQTLTFSWSSAYCPSGCGPAIYALVIDTVNGDFTSPYYMASVPGNDSSYELDLATLNLLLIDTKTPEQGSREVFWRVLTSGNNGQVIYSPVTNRLVLQNHSMNNENHPYSLINPSNIAVITLSGDSNTQMNFKWESTFTPVDGPSEYYLAFDTLGASPLFSNPVLQFQVPGHGNDTSINLTYGTLDHALDSIYGKGWNKVKLMWAAIAQIDGTLYYPVSSYSIELRSGTITSLADQDTDKPRVYPNPAVSQVEISVPGQDFSYRLYNACGMLVKEGHVEGNTTSLDLKGLEKGIYFIRIEQDRAVNSLRLVLSH